MTIKPSVYETRIFGEVFRIRSNFVQPTCPVEVEGRCGWVDTGYQAGDCARDPRIAMRWTLEETLGIGVFDPDDPEDTRMYLAIERAVAEMT